MIPSITATSHEPFDKVMTRLSRVRSAPIAPMLVSIADISIEPVLISAARKVPLIQFAWRARRCRMFEQGRILRGMERVAGIEPA